MSDILNHTPFNIGFNDHMMGTRKVSHHPFFKFWQVVTFLPVQILKLNLE